MKRIAPGTKVRIGSGHFGYVQSHTAVAVEIAFFGYTGHDLSNIEVLWITDKDVSPVKMDGDDPPA